MAIAVPCMAQIAMIVGLVGARGGQYLGVVFATLFFVLTVKGILLNKFLKGRSPEILVEIPPYRQPQLIAVLKKLGIDIVIHPEAAAAGYIEELITKPGVLDLAFISRGQAEIMEMQIKEKSKIAGKKISEIDHPPGSAIVALYEGKNLIIPGQEDTIKVGQKILILAKRDVAEKVRKMIQ